MISEKGIRGKGGDGLAVIDQQRMLNHDLVLTNNTGSKRGWGLKGCR